MNQKEEISDLKNQIAQLKSKSKEADTVIGQLQAELIEEKKKIETVSQSRAMYSMRLAGALGAAEGSFTRKMRAEDKVIEYLKTCPTITAVLNLREWADGQSNLKKDVEAALAKPSSIEHKNRLNRVIKLLAAIRGSYTEVLRSEIDLASQELEEMRDGKTGI